MKRVFSAALLLLPLTAAVAGATSRNDDRPLQQLFGSAVAIAGDQAFVGEPRGAKPGTVHLYRRGPAGWRAAGTLTAPAGAPNDGFGATVATDGTTLLVSRIDLLNGADSGKGEVHVFRKNATGAWTAAGVLQAPTRVARADFGRAMVISGDMAMIGAPQDGNGAVYIFRRGANGAWSSAGVAAALAAEAGDRFGSALALDGARLAVGAPGRAMRKGATFVFARQGDGSWSQEAMLVAARGTDNSALGSALVIKGDRLVVGAPGAVALSGAGGGTAGAAFIFERSSSGQWRERHTLMPFQLTGARFGTSLAFAGDELWVGAPASDRNTGRVYRVRMEKDGSVGAMTRLDVPEMEPGASLAGTMAVSGADAVVGMPSDAGGLGTVLFLGRTPAGAWTSRGMLYPATDEKAYAAVKGKEVDCADNGKAGEFECGNTSLFSFLPLSAIGGKRGTRMNDNWGYTDPVTKREIAILGRTDGTSFVDVTDPANPRYLGDLPKTKGSPSAAWRDMKVYKDHVFIVADNSAEHGMQVFDLARLRTVRTPQVFAPDVTYDRINSAHNILVNEETGYVYTVGNSGGGETCGGHDGVAGMGKRGHVYSVCGHNSSR